jgi:hypothetical protein
MNSTLRLCLATAGLALIATAAYAQSAKEEIIWNDPPKPSTTAPASTGKSGVSAPTPLVPPPAPAPIRDDYAAKPKSDSGRTESAKNTATGAWTDPSMPSKGTVGKSNTSVAASTPTPGVAGPCREFEQDVIIDGHREKAHGRACRQVDGSWKLQN